MQPTSRASARTAPSRHATATSVCLNGEQYEQRSKQDRSGSLELHREAANPAGLGLARPPWSCDGRHRRRRHGRACRAPARRTGDSMTARPAINSILSAAPAPLHVMIIGGGIGGLTLAKGLKKSGVSVAVYERDRTMTDRVQGYRVDINPAGSRALHECLPAPLFGVFAQTCGKHPFG